MAIIASNNGLSFHVDATEFNEALRKLSIYSKKTAAELVNKKALWITRKAFWKTWQVPAANVAAELGMTEKKVFRTLKSGKQSKRGKNMKFFGRGAARKNAPLLALIIQSRVGKGGKFGLSESPWKGVDRATGAQRMLERMRKVYAVRMKSLGFIKSGWLEALYGLLAATRSAKGPARPTGQAANMQRAGVKRVGAAKGGFDAAGPNATLAVARIWNTAARDSKTLAVLTGPLQEAIDSEAGDTFKRAWELEMAEAARNAGCLVGIV